MIDLVGRHAGDLLLPRRRVGDVVVVGRGDVAAAEAAVDAVVRAQQVEHRRDQRLAVGERELLHRHVAQQDVRALVVVAEGLVLDAAEVGERDRLDVVARVDQRQRELRLGARAAFLRLEVPLAEVAARLLAPAIADRAQRRDDGAGRLVDGDRSSIRGCWPGRACRRSRRRARGGRRRTGCRA